MKPIIPPKYNIGIRVKNCSQELLHALEPWCSRIYSDAEWMKYITLEQPNTKFDLRKRCHSLTEIDKNDYDDILVEIEGSLFNQQDFQYIQQLSEIIKDSGEIGTFKLGNLTISITRIKNYEKTLIKVS